MFFHLPHEKFIENEVNDKVFLPTLSEIKLTAKSHMILRLAINILRNYLHLPYILYLQVRIKFEIDTNLGSVRNENLVREKKNIHFEMEDHEHRSVPLHFH